MPGFCLGRDKEQGQRMEIWVRHHLSHIINTCTWEEFDTVIYEATKVGYINMECEKVRPLNLNQARPTWWYRSWTLFFIYHFRIPYHLNSHIPNSPVQYLNTNLIESTEVSNDGFGRRPDKRTIISKDHISMLFQSQESKIFLSCFYFY